MKRSKTSCFETHSVAATLIAIPPVLVLFGPVLATEHLFLVLMLSAMLLLLRVAAEREVVGLIAGTSSGLAILTRGEAVFCVPALVMFVWFGSGLPVIKKRLRWPSPRSSTQIGE